MGAAAALTRLLPLLVTLLAAAAAPSLDLKLPDEKDDVHILQAHAHTFIGAILPVRTRGSGLYGCGPANKTSETILEALRMILDSINNGSSKPKIGIRLMDSCGRKRVAVDLLAKMFPELQTGLEDPPLPQNHRLAGLIDGAGLADDAGDAGAALLAARVAVAPLREWLPVTSRVKALMAVVKYLRWERVVVVRSEDEDSDDALWREWAAAQSKEGPCVVAVERNVSAALSHGLPVVVLVPQEEVYPLLRSISNHSSPATIFLANRPDRELRNFNIPTELSVLSLAPGRLPPGLDPEPHSLAGISLAEAIVSAGQSLGLIALAILRSDNVFGMTRLEFLNSNFAPLAAAAARGDLPSGDANSWKSLILSPSSVNIVRIDESTENVLKVDVHSGVVHALSPKLSFRLPQTPMNSNTTCLSAARSSGARRIEDQHHNNGLLYDEFHTLLESPQGIYMVLFAPMHSAAKGRSPIYCPVFDHDTADVISARRLEAFLWALRRLNQQVAREDSSIQVGGLLGDTCSSNIHAMSLAARTPGNGGHGIAVVVNALPSSDAKSAADILADREITSIATNHLLDTAQSLPHPYTLQVETSLQNIVTSILKLLSHLGWSYVSVVHSSGAGSDHERGFQLFHSAAARHGVCIAATLDVSRGEDLDDDAVAKLVGARAEGARGVVVWADEEGSRRLFRAVARAVAQVTLRREDLFWFLASPLGETGGVLDEFGNVVGGALVFGPHHRAVPEFQHHLAHLSLNNGNITSVEKEWTRFYREQCGNKPCSADHPTAVAGDWAIIQSVYAAGAALAKLARSGCANSRPSCVFDGESLLIGEAINRAVRQSISTRADGPAGTDYHFSSSGSGAIGVEVQNFRRRTGSRSRSLGDVFFQRVAVFSDDRFSSLENMVAYRDAGDEVILSSLTSQCVGAENKCLRCRSSHPKTLGDWIVNWPDNKPPDSKSKKVTVMIAATLAVHESSANPAQCGQTVSTTGVEQLEAFLWAVDQVNRNWTDPGVKLGAITLDTCGSSLRTSRHVAELLSSESSPGSLVVALVAGGETRLAAPVADAAAAAGLPAMAPASRGPPPDRKTHPPYPLQLAPSANKTASALAALITKLKRSCVGVLYLKDALDYEEAAVQLEKQLTVATGPVVSVIKSSLTASAAATRSSSATRESILRLRRPTSNAPSQVVVVLAPPDHVDKVLSIVAGLNDEGLWTSNNVIWVTLGAEQVLMTHSSHISTAFSLKPRTGRVPELERHFENLTPDRNFRDPWFEEYWSSVFHCRGSSCKSNTSQILTTERLRQNPDVPNIINSVLAVGHALQTVRREMCPDQHIVARTFCRPMAEVSRVRSRLLEILPRMAFVGAGPRAVAFSSAGESANSGIEVLMMESSSFSPKLIADIDSSGSVSWVDPDTLKVFENSSDDESCEVLYNVNVTVPKSKEVIRKSEVPAEMNGHAFQVAGSGNSSTALLAVLPVHGREEAGFRCGELNEYAVCAAATVMYAALLAKRNNSDGNSVGTTIVDSCSQPERAFSSLFSVLAASPLPKFAVALVFDGKDDDAVRPLLAAQGIPQAPPSARLEDAKSGRAEPELRAREASLAAALLDVAAALRGPSTVVVHGSSPRARSLARAIESASLARCGGDTGGGDSDGDDDMAAGVCLSAVLPAPPGLHGGSETRPGAQYLLASQIPGAVVIVAPSSADDMSALLTAAQSPLVPRLSFVVPAASSRQAASLRAVGHTVLSVVPDTSVAELVDDIEAAENITPAEMTSETAFQRWLEKPEDTGLPTTWLTRLDSARCSQEQGPWKISDLVKLVSMLHRENKTVANMTTDNLVEAMNRQENLSENLEEITSFKIWRNVQAVGSWTSERKLSLTTHPEVLLLEENVISGRPSALHNMQFMWALSLGAVALLGMLLTLATAVFFLSAAAVARTPISGSAGTSVLGYLILLALLVLHGGVFSLVLAPSEASCGARRLFPAVAYALIFSAMFLKVLTTWQMCERKGVALGPLPLVLRALALAAPQLLVSVGWIVFVPPVVHSVPAVMANGGTVWLCYPAAAGDADMHQLLSMAYTCLLMVATAVVALLCSSKEELLEEGTMLHQESRSILAAALAVAVQLGCWGLAIVSLMPGSNHPFREPVAAGVHTTASATLLACLFLPKLRLYLKLKRNARDAANIAASAAARPQTVYGVSHFQQPFGGKLNPVDMFVGDSASTAASHSASDSSSTSAGHYSDPTQVIPSSLYSLDMFTGHTGQTAIPDVPIDVPVGTLRSVRSDAHHGQCGTLRSDAHHAQCGTLRAASMAGTLRGNVIGANLGGTLRGNIGGTLRASRGGLHFMPGTNEFTPPHRTSSTLLLPSQEGVSYM